MEPIYVWSLMGTAIAVLAAACIYLGRLVLSQRHKLKTFTTARKQSMMDDLELATSDQLLGELRKRPGAPYLMLSPIQGEDHQGISIEIHNIPPVPCLQMLHMATSLTFHELKKRGVEIPDFPGGPDQECEEGEEWKQDF
jgi:hypothetical protein